MTAVSPAAVLCFIEIFVEVIKINPLSLRVFLKIENYVTKQTYL